MIVFQPPAVQFEKPIIFQTTGPRSRLVPGDELHLNESLYSPSGEYRFAFQGSDGNAVLYNRAMSAIWQPSPSLQGRGAIRIVMQTDGNLVAYDAQMRPVWYTATDGHPQAFVQMQDDGNLVLYSEGKDALWWSDTMGGRWHGNDDDDSGWLSKIVKAAGRPFEAAAHLVAQGFNALADLAAKIPIIGPALHGIIKLESAIFSFTDAVLDGQRIDRAAVANLRDQITAVREVAPYAQTVVSMIPGIGQGASAAIGAGLALAQGMPITEAIKAGVRGALPGGPLAASAFDLTIAAASGDNLVVAAGNAALGNLGLPPAAKDGLSKALSVVYRASQGDNIPLAALDEARSYMPTEAGKKAFDVGLAVAHGKRLQDAVVTGIKNLAPEGLDKLRNVGANILANTPVLQAGAKALASVAPSGGAGGHGSWAQKPIQTAKDGYALGVGLMSHAGVNEDVVKAVRDKLQPTEKQGFDMGIAAYNGLVMSPTSLANMSVTAQAGFVITQGLAGKSTLPPIAKTFYLVPQVAPGHLIAQADIRSREGFWGWLKRTLLHL